MKHLSLIIILIICSSLSGILKNDLVYYHYTDQLQKIGLTGMPYLNYSSDNGLGVGVQGILFDASPDSLGFNPFEVQLDFSMTTKDEKKAEFDYSKTFIQSKSELIAHFEYKRKPADFWGIGGQTPEENKEEYRHEQFINYIKFKKELYPNLLIGPIVSLNAYRMLERSDSLQLSQEIIPGSESSYLVSGIGFSWDYRHLDYLSYPRNGYRIIHEISLYHKTIGSEYQFLNSLLDLRAYKSILPNHIFCVQIISHNQSGDIPFHMMTKQGSSTMMRGFPNGRFIDHHLFSGQIEYRSPFFERVGLAVFSSFGNTYHQFNQFKLSDTHFTYGLGLRINVSKENMLNFRADLAFSEEGKQIYLKVGEAF